MSELGEIIAVEVGHDEPDPDCPFCPPPKNKPYTTYPGSANNSGKLEKIMTDPSKLTSEQSDARDQTAAVDDKGYDQEQPRPAKRLKDDTKWYTFQAHHLISGKQALEGHVFEDWILASGRNEAATGYSVNCTGNGFWAPSVPKKYVGRWSARKKVLTDDERQALAEKVMKDFTAQVHIGPHNISDPDDPDGDKHTSYDVYIKQMLKEMDDRVVAWKEECFLAKSDDKKPQATHHVHNNLDNLSEHLKNKISGSHYNWDIFLSQYAMNYHKPVCAHVAEEDL